MKRGFTLIETLIYIALFALLIGGGISSAFSLIASSDRIGTQAMLEEEGNFLLAKIGWALEQPDTGVEVNAEGEIVLVHGAMPPTVLSNTNVEVENFSVTPTSYSFMLRTRMGSGQEITEEFTRARYEYVY